MKSEAIKRVYEKPSNVSLTLDQYQGVLDKSSAAQALLTLMVAAYGPQTDNEDREVYRTAEIVKDIVRDIEHIICTAEAGHAKS